MPESKLLGTLPDGRSRAVAGHDLADEFAKAAQGIAERSAVGPVEWREVPFIGPFVVGDQLTVMAYELSAALDGLERAGEEVWSVVMPRRSGGFTMTAAASEIAAIPTTTVTSATSASAASPPAQAAERTPSAERINVEQVVAELFEHVRTLSLAC